MTVKWSEVKIGDQVILGDLFPEVHIVIDFPKTGTKYAGGSLAEVQILNVRKGYSLPVLISREGQVERVESKKL